MANVLTTASTILCGHGGTVAVSGSAKLTVGKKPVLLRSGIEGKGVSGCATQTNSQAGTVQCAKVMSVTGGEATKITVGKQRVMLDAGLAGTTVGDPPIASNPPALFSAQAGQQKLTAE